jgi:7-cyano-7-deazaguanine synthase in queuosine biosynthesis
MPRREHLVLCGGVNRPADAGVHTLQLRLPEQPSSNVRLRITDISKRLVANMPDVLIDLLQVAAYVYAADSGIPRGGKIDAQMGARWRRTFRFVIPVLCVELWNSKAVASALVDTLSFLSEDNYAFEFVPNDERPPLPSYFDFSAEHGAGFSPDEVVLFSGGLDSFSGAVETLVAHARSVVLVSHRSASTIASAQKRLIEEMRRRLAANRILHVPVWANLDASVSQESTHRTRSFLFAALGAVTARLFNLDRIQFFENGVVSLNLPPVAQVVGARATRTTHPQALRGFRTLMSALFGRAFDVVNPFAWMTKAEVVARIATNGFSGLIRDTRSCARVRDMTIHHPHCGHCSQCIDRRFAVLAAGQENEDPAEAYKVELFTDERPPGPDREMSLAYVRSASEVNKMADVAFFSRYGEASRAIEFFSEPAGRAAERIFDLHRRHVAAVCRVFDQALSSHAADLREGSLPSTCLLALVAGQRGADAVSEYPEPSQPPKQAMATRLEIRLAVDPNHRRVVFDRWGEVRGAGAELLMLLADIFRQAAIVELAPERYPFVQTRDLLSKLHIGSDQTLRRRVLRCRKQIEKLATNAGDPPPSTDDVIENNQWHGYRLNPDLVRIVAITELTSLSPELKNGFR